MVARELGLNRCTGFGQAEVKWQVWLKQASHVVLQEALAGFL